MKEVYKPELSNKTIKREINSLFVDGADKNTSALILDGENLFTTRQLIKKGVKPNNIFVPNPFSYDEMVKFCKKNKLMKINLYNKLLNDFLQTDFIASFKQTKNPLYIWLDYCCCFQGNEHTNPREDIRLLLNVLSKIIQIKNRIKLSVTFTYRQPKSNFKHERYIEIVNYICREGHKNFAVIPTTHRIYKLYYIEFLLKPFKNNPHNRR